MKTMTEDFMIDGKAWVEERAHSAVMKCTAEELEPGPISACQEHVEREFAPVAELIEVLQLCDGDGRRAKSIWASEDAAVLELCERFGFGAVMDSVARLWFLRDPLGAHTVGPCAAIVRDALAKLEKEQE